MGTAAALAVYALLLTAAAVAVWLRPLLALYAFVVGLALHNAVMAALYAAGIRGTSLSAISAWKEILLAVAIVSVAANAVRRRRLPFRPALVDWLALAYAALVVVYALIPQHALGGEAGRKAVALAVRHDLVPVAAFMLGRSLRVGAADLRRLAWTFLGTAGFVAAIGLVDDYAVSIAWWRGNGVVGYFHRQLGFDYHGTGGLPENFVYNTGSEQHFLRRLVSTFLSPLASGYLFVVALLFAAAAGLRSRLALALGVVAAAGLLFTFSRSSLAVLAGGLVVLALVTRRPAWLAPAAVTVGVAIAWVHVFPSVAPTGRWTQADLVRQRAYAAAHPGADPASATSANEPSIRSHLSSLRAGFRTMADHPQGYGPGNVGQAASRTGTPLKAGESNYTELGVELGVLGAVLWTLWGLTVLAGLVRAALAGGETAPWAAGFAAAFAAVLALAIQTDVIGDPWVSYCVWALAGALVVPLRLRGRDEAHDGGPALAPVEAGPAHVA
jgi:hypothetical protein